MCDNEHFMFTRGLKELSICGVAMYYRVITRVYGRDFMGTNHMKENREEAPADVFSLTFVEIELTSRYSSLDWIERA